MQPVTIITSSAAPKEQSENTDQMNWGNLHAYGKNCIIA